MATNKRVRWGVKQLRLKRAADLGRDVTLEEVSQSTGIGLSTLSQIENNKVRGVRFETLERLAEYYGLSNSAQLLLMEDEEHIDHIRRPGLAPASLLAAAH